MEETLARWSDFILFFFYLLFLDLETRSAPSSFSRLPYRSECLSDEKKHTKILKFEILKVRVFHGTIS